MVDVQPELERETRNMGRASRRRELRAPNGRQAVLSVCGEYWVGMLIDEGCSRGPKKYGGFIVIDDSPGNFKVRLEREFDRKSPEYKEVGRNFYGQNTNPNATPYKTFQVSGVVEGRTCQLFTR